MDSPARRILMRDRCAEQRHQSIPAVLINGALETVNLGCNQLECSPHDHSEILGIELLTNRGKSGDIAEQHSYLSPLTFNCRMLGPNFVGQMRWWLKRLRSGRLVKGLKCGRWRLRTSFFRRGTYLL
jgi:hypothetical protein